MKDVLLSLAIHYERDVVLARQRARRIAELLGCDGQDQTRIATAVSEIARNAFEYAGGGRVEFRVEGVTPPQLLSVRVSDEGPGITDLPSILSGRYRSSTGMGLGIAGARRLMDQFEIDSRSGAGTTVVLRKLLPRPPQVIGPAATAALVEALAREQPRDAMEEVQRQNQELLRALQVLEENQEELRALNHELEDTNRGVVALYAELDEKADHLRRADELKSRFLSNMSHEFRTPVNSIQALARLILDRIDGDLTTEQERQVTFIRTAADSLAELVNDLLDLAKVEAGKIEVRPVHFDVEHLFGALRGMLRPLLVSESVSLVFEPADQLPPLHSDEAKVSQILRNFISNALKFTERGEVRVRARALAGRDAVEFAVSDTGIGIAPEDLETVFQEFTQIDSPIQRRVKGTGLGLPLCRKLAELLGGAVRVESEPGVGSTFVATIPLHYQHAGASQRSWDIDPSQIPLLVVEDSVETALVYEKMLYGAGYQVHAARSVREARAAIAAVKPRAILLDVMLRGEDTWGLLAELKRSPATQAIPVAVVSSVEDEQKGIALGADAYVVKPIDRNRLLQTVTRLLAPDEIKRILLVDDETISRYLLRHNLEAPRYEIVEAETGSEGLRKARSERPDVIFLDLGMPDIDGVEVLRRLKEDAATRHIPVVIVTARHLESADHAMLSEATSVLTKDRVSRETALAAMEAAFQPARGPS